MNYPTKKCIKCGVECLGEVCGDCFLFGKELPIIERQVISLRQLSSKYESKTVTFDALISSTGEFRTVTTQVDAYCFNCQYVQTIIGNGYENPKMPYCNKCHIRLKNRKIQQGI